VPQSSPNQLPAEVGAFPLVDHSGLFGPGVESQESPLRQYWRIFYKRRLLILAITAFCIAIGILMAMLTQREYAATVTIQVARDSAKVIDLGGVEQTGDAFDQEFYETQYQLLKSRSLSEAVVRDLKLADNYAFLGDFNTENPDELKEIDRAKRFSMATDIVNSNTVINPVANSSIINVRYNSPNPVMERRRSPIRWRRISSNRTCRDVSKPQLMRASSCKTASTRSGRSLSNPSASRFNMRSSRGL
jgi:capsular polysaccharide biosynthesis protein